VTRLPLSALTLDAVQAEAVRTHLTHRPEMALLSRDTPDLVKLTALVTAVGTLANRIAADVASHHYVGLERTAERVSEAQAVLVGELIHTAALALMWVESLEGGVT
jgi:hypothetical protein